LIHNASRISSFQALYKVFVSLLPLSVTENLDAHPPFADQAQHIWWYTVSPVDPSTTQYQRLIREGYFKIQEQAWPFRGCRFDENPSIEI
jgi:hypothetical protein